MKARDMIPEARSLARECGERQLKRYEALSALGRFHGRTLLDMDCGPGDLYSYVLASRQSPLYTGIDGSAETVGLARSRFAGQSGCRFEQGRAAEYQPETPFDFVVAGSLERALLDGGSASLGRVISRLFSWCTVGTAVSFQSLRAPSRAPRGLYVDPTAAVKAAFRLTPSVRLAHDYLPDDFTVYLYRTPTWRAAPAQGAPS
jgi:hypothetical protein